jgi:hypothetical protein
MKEKLKTPLKWPWAICRLVCAQCGQISEIDLETAQKLISVMEINGNRPEIPLEKRGDFKGYYFESSYCKNCSTKEVVIRIKEIELNQ